MRDDLALQTLEVLIYLDRDYCHLLVDLAQVLPLSNGIGGQSPHYTHEVLDFVDLLLDDG